MPSISEQVKFYDKFWRGHTLISCWGMERTGVILTELARQRIDSPNILDLGCGTGWLSNILSNYGAVTGIELSVEAIEAAKERFPQVNFVSGDFFAVDFDDKFDFVIASEVLEHFEDQESLIDKIATVLKPGGMLVITTPNGLLQQEADVRASLDGRWQPIENWRSPKELYRLISRKLSVDKHYSIELGWGHAGLRRIINSTKFNKILRKIGLNKTWDNFRRATKQGLHLVVVAKKS
jgi:SAM-dependent methyltransferase